MVAMIDNAGIKGGDALTAKASGLGKLLDVYA